MSELIHVKLEYEEALRAKRDVLSSEMGLLKITKAIRNHKVIRSEELKHKLKLGRKIRELKTDLTKLQQVLPKMKVPEIIRKDQNNEETPETKSIVKKKKEPKDYDLEFQLEEIQRKLRELS